MVALEILSSWVRFKKNACSSCMAGCCTLPVEVSIFDLLRLELITEDLAAEGGKKVFSKLRKKRILKSFSQKTQLFILEQMRGSDCLFLDSKTRACTVYLKRPEVCRQFPRVVGPRVGYCPFVAKKMAVL